MRLISWRAARNRTQCSSVTATGTKSRTDSGTCRANFSFGQISHGRIHKSFHSVVDSMRLLCQMPRKAWSGKVCMCSMQEFLGFSPDLICAKFCLGFLFVFVTFPRLQPHQLVCMPVAASNSAVCALIATWQYISPPCRAPYLAHTHTETHMCLLNSVPYLWGQHQSPRALEASLASAVGSRFDICLRVKADR